MTEQLAQSRLALWRQMTQVPHRAYGPMVGVFKDTIAEDPDFSARAMVHIFKTSKIRDQQDAAIIAMLSAKSKHGGAYYLYRQAGKAMLLGDRVYNIEPEGPWGIEPYRILRVIDYMASPYVVTVAGQEEERFRTEAAARRAMPRIARREMTKRDRKWRPGPNDTDEALVRRLAVNVALDVNHTKSPRLMRVVVSDYLEALQSDPGWWYAVEFQNRTALHELYKNKSMTPRGFNPPAWVREAVFEGKYPAGSKRTALQTIAGSKDPEVWYQLATSHKLDDRILASVLPDTVEAKMVRVSVMSPTQVRNNLKWFEREGLTDIPEVKQVITEKLAKATSSSGAFERKSAEVTDADLVEAKRQARDAAAKSGQQIEGDVAVCVDISSSMEAALTKGAVIAAHIAANAKDRVYMSFFQETARAFDVTGKSLSEIEEITSLLTPYGWTSMASAYKALEKKGFIPNKMVFVTDQGENRGSLARELQRTNWEGNISIVAVGRNSRALEDNLRDAGYGTDVIVASDTEDYLLAEQVAELLGGPAAETIADKIAAVEIPKIV